MPPEPKGPLGPPELPELLDPPDLPSQPDLTGPPDWLDLDQRLIAQARASAARVAGEVQAFIDRHTTVSIERAVIRLLGVDGVTEDEWPLPNAVVENIQVGAPDVLRGADENAGLARGAAYWLANAVLHFGDSPQEIAEAVGRGAFDLTEIPQHDDGAIRWTALELAVPAMEQIAANRRRRERALAINGLDGRWAPTGADQGRCHRHKPLLYVIVATGDIREDVVQAQAAVRQGADIVAVIRSTGQSLFDYVPYGEVRGGFGGTYATQENFRIMRRALDEVGAELGGGAGGGGGGGRVAGGARYPLQVNYCSGLCMPEIAAMGALERLDMMLNDAMYGILFRDINMQRTFVDQHFSRALNACAGIIINTGEDNYTTVDDPIRAAHTVLASQFINEQFAHRAGLPDEQIGLGHAFQIDPELEDGLLLEIAQAQMTRQIFPRSPLKYMPPTRHITGNIFRAYLMQAMFNLVGVLTGQDIQLLGMLTEATHTPFMQDRWLAVDGARYVMGTARHLREEVLFRRGGAVERRAQQVLGEAAALLKEVEATGLMAALEKGVFAGVRRRIDGGKGADGVIRKAPDYFNPILEVAAPFTAVGGKGGVQQGGVKSL